MYTDHVNRLYSAWQEAETRMMQKHARLYDVRCADCRTQYDNPENFATVLHVLYVAEARYKQAAREA